MYMRKNKFDTNIFKIIFAFIFYRKKILNRLLDAPEVSFAAKLPFEFLIMRFN